MSAPIKRTPWLTAKNYPYLNWWETPDSEALVCFVELRRLCRELFGESPGKGDRVRIHAQECPRGEWICICSQLLRGPAGHFVVVDRLYRMLGGHEGWRGHVWIEW